MNRLRRRIKSQPQVPAVKPARKKISVSATYDAARTTRNNAGHWSYADYKSADLDANTEVRKVIRCRARYEAQNNSYAKGIIETLANDVIGTGARLQINDCAEKIATQIERDFQGWAKEINLVEKLRTAKVAKTIDGEAFLLLTTNPKIANKVKLDLQPIDADRVTSTTALILDNVIDGVTLDKYGNVVNYSVYDKHPSECLLKEIQTIPAKYILHLYNVNRPGQHRGVSEIAPALDLFGQLRDWTVACLTAAQTAACLTGFIRTDAPAGGEAEELEPLETIPLEVGQMLTLPSGWDITFSKAEQPVSTYKDFKNEILAEIGRVLNIPYNIAKCDSQNASYASSRLDTQIYFKTVRLEQAYFIRNCLEPLFAAWLQEYTLDGKVKLPKFSSSFMFELGMTEHSDPLKMANAQGAELRNLTTSLATIYAEKGKDYEKELKQIAYERELLKGLGLSLGEVLPEVNDSRIGEDQSSMPTEDNQE